MPVANMPSTLRMARWSIVWYLGTDVSVALTGTCTR
jgi:hypothetical protein